MKHTILTQAATIKKLLAIGLPALFLTPMALNAQAENSADADGEQWYDPSDWFDGEGLGGEDLYTFPYYGPYWTGAYWSRELDHDESDEGYNYGIHYEWNEDAGKWQQEYGYYDDAYSYKLEWDDEDLKPADTTASSSSSNTNSNNAAARSQTSGEQRSKSQSQNSDQIRSADSKSAKKSNADSKGVQTLTGTIDGFRKMDLEYTSGLTAKHTLARIALEDGTNAVIDLGYSSLETADLKQGDTVKLKGNRGQINGQNVFVATELNVDGETLYIERAIALQAAASAHDRSKGKASQRSASAADVITLEGKLEDHTVLKIGSDSKTLVKLRLESGQAATVDLGPNTSLSDLDLEAGDQIRVRGRKTQIENRSVLTAQSISVEGESVKG